MSTPCFDSTFGFFLVGFAFGLGCLGGGVGGAGGKDAPVLL